MTVWSRVRHRLDDLVARVGTTDPHEALERLSRQHERILNAAGEGIYELDDQGRTRFVNPAAARLLGYEHEPQALIGRPVHDVLHGAGTPDAADRPPVDESICPIHTALLDGVESYVKDDLFWTRDGTSFPVEYICTPITERDRILGVVITFQNIAERRLIEGEIVRLRDMALESARLRSEFLANMSHEVRTPLNGIIGMTGILLETELTVEQRRAAAIIKASADALLTIVNDILDFSKIDSGKLQFETLDFDLRDVVDGTIDAFAERARTKGLALIGTVDPGVPTAVRGDPGRLRQVFTNLIGNAIKFTEQGQVTLDITREDLVKASADGSRPTQVVIRVAVRDTGIGISPVQQRHLFQPFVQADTSTTRMYGGTGLGLAISKQIVEQMHGTIGVESEAGKGSQFWFTARLEMQPEVTRRASAAAATDAAARPFRAAAGQRFARPGSSSAAGQPGAAHVPVPPASPPGRRPRVLVVEDNIVNQQVAVQQLGKLGYTADAVANGHEALEALTRIPYDLVLMDCQMPDLDGYDATRELRRREGTSRHTRVIAMTASALPTDRQRCLDAGMDDYVSKPVTLEHLKTVVDRYLIDPAAEVEKGHVPLPLALVGVIDPAMWQSLHGIQREHGDDFVQATFALYLDFARSCLDTLREALAAGDLQALARAAHSLKGSSSILGLNRMTALSAALTQVAGPEDETEVIRLLERLTQEFRRVKAAVEAELSGSGTSGVAERRT